MIGGLPDATALALAQQLVLAVGILMGGTLLAACANFPEFWDQDGQGGRPITASVYGLAPILMWIALALSWLSGTCFAKAVNPSFRRARKRTAAGLPAAPQSDCRDSAICTSNPLSTTMPAAGSPGGTNPEPCATTCLFQPAVSSAFPISSIKATASGSSSTEKSNGVPRNSLRVSANRCWDEGRSSSGYRPNIPERSRLRRERQM